MANADIAWLRSKSGRLRLWQTYLNTSQRRIHFLFVSRQQLIRLFVFFLYKKDGVGKETIYVFLFKSTQTETECFLLARSFVLCENHFETNRKSNYRNRPKEIDSTRGNFCLFVCLIF